ALFVCAQHPATTRSGLPFDTHPSRSERQQLLRQLDEMYGRRNAEIRELSDADLQNPSTVGPERFPMDGIVLHVNKELIHHGAEISLLRDLYRWQDGAVEPLRDRWR
ncbi:DinB family protein, partial [Streptomyces monashensis]|uniref:DinB family protein n=1 Tax=Streptomyces monashensis TaxID=1678012 RepID=UPI0033E27BBF